MQPEVFILDIFSPDFKKVIGGAESFIGVIIHST